MEGLTQDQLRALFDRIVEICEVKLYDPRLNGVDWRRRAEEHRARILSSRGSEELERSVNDLIKELRVSHAGFYHEGRPRVAGKMAISATLFADRQRWIFQDVHPGGPAQKAGIQPGDVLLQVRDTAIAPPELPVFPLGTTATLAIERRDGSHARVMVEVPKSKTKKRPLIELQPVTSLSLANGIGWLKVSMFPGAIGIDVARDINRAVRSLDCERLIIDLRGNTGGGIGCLRLMSLLTPDRVPVGYSVTRRLAERVFRKEDLPIFDHIPSRKIGIFKLLFRFGFREQSVAVATERTLLEGKGVTPHVEESFSPEAIRSGEDNQLRAAIRAIKDL